MKTVFALFVVLMMTGPAWAQQAAPVDSLQSAAIEASKVAATTWLTHMDAGEIEKTWELAAPIFQQNVSSAEWVSSIKQVRSPLGPFGERTFESAEFHQSLPEAPPGPFVVLTYKTAATATEFVNEILAFMGRDGDWKLVAYYVNQL